MKFLLGRRGRVILAVLCGVNCIWATVSWTITHTAIGQVAVASAVMGIAIWISPDTEPDADPLTMDFKQLWARWLTSFVFMIVAVLMMLVVVPILT